MTEEPWAGGIEGTWAKLTGVAPEGPQINRWASGPHRCKEPLVFHPLPSLESTEGVRCFHLPTELHLVWDRLTWPGWARGPAFLTPGQCSLGDCSLRTLLAGNQQRLRHATSREKTSGFISRASLLNP